MQEFCALTNADLASAAQTEAANLLAAHAVAAYPVPVHRIILAEGADVRKEPTFGEGSLTRTQAGYIVRVNPFSPKTRQRFTMAHELGHIVFDRLVGVGPAVRYRAPQLSINFTDEERFCDAFAAELLMPRTACADLSDWTRISLDSIYQHSLLFDVSFTAMCKRVVDQGLADGVIVRFERDEIKWRVAWRAVNPMTRGFVPVGKSIPEGSALLETPARNVSLIHDSVDLRFLNLGFSRVAITKKTNESIWMLVYPTAVGVGDIVTAKQLRLVNAPLSQTDSTS